MYYADVAIIGGGLAGSMAAAMLGRAGVSGILIDPHNECPPAFRCEKLDQSQLRLLERTGLADAIIPAATPVKQVWVARFGRIVAKRRSNQVGIFYDRLVNQARAAIPGHFPVARATASGISVGPERQVVELSNGDKVAARLIVIATGVGDSLRRLIGIERNETSPCHSISIGFNLAPRGRESFDFPALTYFPERSSARTAYLTLFPIGSVMRANLFVYRDLRDPWLRAFREDPEETMLETMPALRKLLGEFLVTDDVKVRPMNLYSVRGHRTAGVVLVGDAFATSCPAAGTGLNKVLTDVERLCNIHIPRWLATDGMGAEKIAAFYDDPVKVACDRHSADKARRLRLLSTSRALRWKAQRVGKSVGQVGLGALLGAAALLSNWLRLNGGAIGPL